MIRKFLLVAGLALFEPGSTVQLLLAQVVCLIYLAAVLNFAPYKKQSVDFTNQARLLYCMRGWPERNDHTLSCSSDRW